MIAVVVFLVACAAFVTHWWRSDDRDALRSDNAKLRAEVAHLHQVGRLKRLEVTQ